MYSQSMRDALKEVEEYSEQPEEQLDESLVGLIRTTAITVNTAKGHQSGKKVQQHARELRSIGNELQRDKKPLKTHRRRMQRDLEPSQTYS